MTEPDNQAKTVIAKDFNFKKFKPWITISICLLCLVPFIGLNLAKSPLTWGDYSKWGAPSSNSVWGGSYWGLLTSNLVHVQIWHIGFNLLWFWKFGKKIEYQTSKEFYIIFILSSGFICSIYQL